MTKILTQEGYLYATIVVDWFTKKPLGWHLGEQSKATDWMKAIEMALSAENINDNKGLGLSLVSDNGCQPTAKSFKDACKILGIKQIFTSYNNPKGNAETERFFRTLKEELIWTREFKTIKNAEKTIDKYLRIFPKKYRHSKLKYKTPEEFIKQFCLQKIA